MSFFQQVKNIIRFCTPYGMIEAHHEKYARKMAEKEQAIRNYFLSLDPGKQPAEILEIIDYFRQYGFSVMPYPFTRKYHTQDITVFPDLVCSMNYVLHQGKKLYFPRNWGIERIRAYYTGLCREQDAESPHRYETDMYRVMPGEIIADIGAAEGIWALTYAEQAKKIYLFECEQGWQEALLKTFEPWKDKVELVHKFMSALSDGKKQVSLDDYFREKEIHFIKADIEGAELALLAGGRQTLTHAGNMKILLCTYHHQEDATQIEQALLALGFTTEFSPRHIIFIYDKELAPPYIRKGLIRAKK